MMIGILSSQATSLSEFLALLEDEDSVGINLSYESDSSYFCENSMDQSYDIVLNSDCLDSTPFMFQVSSSTLLSQASSPSPMNHIRVELNGQPDELPPHNSLTGSLSLFHELSYVNSSPEFYVEPDSDVNESGEDVKENISVESLLMSGLNCSQISRDRSQPLSQRSQSSVQRSQDNPNVLQVKSLDNSYHSNYENFSQPLVIVPSSSYGSSGSTQLQLDSQSSSSQEGSCCKKHMKFIQKLANRLERKIYNDDCIIDVDALYSPAKNGFLKPPFSHNMLCALAIISDPNSQSEVCEVYKFLMKCFPYFKDAGQHWKNSLRHSLATCDWFAKSDSPRTAKKGYKYKIKASRTNCLRCEIKKQCITDLSKLHHKLSGPTVCEYLISMGLVVLSPQKMTELAQANSRIVNYYSGSSNEN